MKVKGWKQVFQANGQGKKSRGSNTHSRQNKLPKKGHKERPKGHFIILKGRIHQEDINIVNISAPNIGTPKYIKKILEDFKKDIDSNTIIAGDFNTPLSIMDISSKLNINKDIVSLNNTLMKYIDEMVLTDYIYIQLFIPKKQSTHSFQVYMDRFQR